jgi:hypothetical protein
VPKARSATPRARSSTARSPRSTGQVTVAVDALRDAIERRGLTDADLAALGFTADQITTIRSTP